MTFRKVEKESTTIEKVVNRFKIEKEGPQFSTDISKYLIYWVKMNRDSKSRKFLIYVM